jgi:glycerol-3-phosphate dehydrogenase (NAD(P)+)
VLPEGVRVALSDAEALEGAEVVVSAVPVQFARGAWERVRRWVPSGADVVSVAKGIESRTLLRPTEVIASVLGSGAGRGYAALSGPTIATELAKGLPSTMVAASEDEGFARRVQGMFSTSSLRVYSNTDLVGVELAGATKNVIAIAAGVLDGLSAGFNAKSALLARGLAEITRLGVALGARRETFSGVAGVGDLATTCFSPEGRNRSCGEALGRGASLDEYLGKSPFVVEGVATTKGVLELAEQAGVEMPITRAVYSVLFEGVDPVAAIQELMSRGLRGE